MKEIVVMFYCLEHKVPMISRKAKYSHYYYGCPYHNNKNNTTCGNRIYSEAVEEITDEVLYFASCHQLDTSQLLETVNYEYKVLYFDDEEIQVGVRKKEKRTKI